MSTLQIIGSKKDLQHFVDVVIDTYKEKHSRETTITSDDQRLSQTECAQMLDVSVVTLINYRKKNLIPFYKIGSRVFYSRKEVLSAIRKGRLKNQS